MDLASSPSRARARARVHRDVSACERDASARARSAIVIKGDANWWRSEVRPKARVQGLCAFLRARSPSPPPLLAAAAVEVPEIPDLADATLISMLDVITVTIIDSRDTCAAMRARSGSSRSLQVDNDDG